MSVKKTPQMRGFFTFQRQGAITFNLKNRAVYYLAKWLMNASNDRPHCEPDMRRGFYFRKTATARRT